MLNHPLRLSVQREAQLAAELIAGGVTQLGRANHSQPGLYTQAFFGLTNGLERMGKLIFLADHAVRNNGAFPTNRDLRRIGHDLVSLLARCKLIGDGLPGREHEDRPSDPIHRAIEETLSRFATELRYYNLNHLSGAAQGQQDPIALWWERVATPICERHYSARQRQRDALDAAVLNSAVSSGVSVEHTTEGGQPIRNILAFVARAGATRVVQRYGRLYTLQIVRWLTSLVVVLSHRGAYERRIAALFGLHEPFSIFRADDAYMRQRKTWSIYT